MSDLTQARDATALSGIPVAGVPGIPVLAEYALARFLELRAQQNGEHE